MTAPLVLHDVHARAGASFTVLGAREMVDAYGAAEDEVGAVRRRAGLLDWGGGTRLQVTYAGKRTAYDFLEGLLSNRLPEAPTALGCYATLLTGTGKIIVDCRALVRDDGILVTTESPAGAAMRDTLTKYGFLDDIDVADVSDELGMLGVYGPDSAALLERALHAPLPGLEADALLPITSAAGEVLVTRSQATGEVGFDLFVSSDRLGAVWDALVQAGVTPIGLGAFHVARVEAAVPWMNAELDDRVLPNQVNLERAISYTKGCFVGQEAVAKLHYLGRSNKQLVGLLLGAAAPPQRDTDVARDGKTVGRITSAVVSPARGQTIALALCKPAVAEPGTVVRVGDAHDATVTSLPFYAPESTFQQFPEPDIREKPAPPG